MRAPVRVCFVCSGNICRSPTAEVVLTTLAARSGRADLVAVDSAGTGGWHAGDDMDRRSRATLRDAGYEPGRHTARQFAASWFAGHDLVVALDAGHLRALRELADEADDPAGARASLVLLRDFDPDASGDEPGDRDVADPYYGGVDGFGEVLAQVERSCAALLDAIEDAIARDEPPAAPVSRSTGRPGSP